MLTGLLALIQTLLGGIPVIGTLLSGGLGNVITNFFNSKTAIDVARYGGAAQVSVAAQQSRVAGLQAIAGSTGLTVLVFLFALPLAAFLWKVVLFDVVIGSFDGCGGKWSALARCAIYNTDPLRGEVQIWAQTIIVSIFGSLTGLGIASVFRK